MQATSLPTQPIAFDAQPFLIANTTKPEIRIKVLTLTAFRASQEKTIQQIASIIQQVTPDDWRIRASVALDAIHTLPYRADPNIQEQFQGVRYTLQNGGDCEDLSTALVAILFALRIHAELVWMDFPNESQNHVSVLVGPKNGQLWAESIIKTAKLGDSPYDLVKRGFRPSGAITPLNITDTTPTWQPWNDPTTGAVIKTDFALAKRWLDWIIAATTSEQQTELDGQSFALQRERVQAVWNALGEVYNASNFDLFVDPMFKAVFSQHYGGESTKILNADEGTFFKIPWRECIFGQRVIRQWQLLGKNPGDIPNVGNAGLIVRATLRRGTLTTDNRIAGKFTCDGNPFDPVSPGFCDWRPGAFAYRGCAIDGATVEGCGDASHPYNWNVTNWHDPPQGLSPVRPTWSWLLPLRWSFELAGAIARSIDRVGINDWRAGGSVYQLVYNIMGARAVGLLQGNDFAGMRQAIENLPPETDLAAYGRERQRINAETAARVAQRLNSIPIAQAVMGGVSAIMGLLPAAYGQLPTRDAQGKPIFYTRGGFGFQFLEGNTSLWNNPTISIPAPSPVQPLQPAQPYTLDPMTLFLLAKNQGKTEVKDEKKNTLDVHSEPPPPPTTTPPTTETSTVETVGKIGGVGLLLWALSKILR